MAAAYSMDLRTRVLKDVDAGLSSEELAERRTQSAETWVLINDEGSVPGSSLRDESGTYLLEPVSGKSLCSAKAHTVAEWNTEQ
jgi:hypothetical protein